jgi:hypothetical protein
MLKADGSEPSLACGDNQLGLRLMLLCDQVAGAPTAPTPARPPLGRVSTAQPIRPHDARLVRQCPVRYVMDDSLYTHCRQAALNQADCIAAALRTLRFGHPLAWLEWREAKGRSHASRRAGVLIEADESGRAGRLTSFWEDQDRPWRAPGYFAFDFEMRGGGGLGFKVSPNDPRLAERLDEIHRHGSYRIERSWLHEVLRHGDSRSMGAFVQDFLSDGALDFPIICAFQLLLGLPQVVQQRASDLSRLNKARVARRRAPLLEHIEVRMRLGEAAPAGAPGHGGSRSGPRFHWVRGHLVRRDGGVFWRRSHVRGDARRGVLASKTLHVKKSDELAAPGR